MPQVFKREDGYEPKDLIHFGLDHVNAAEKLFEASPSYYDSAGYLVHVGFELLLKAWHLEVLGEFPGVHSLTDLVERLKAEGQQLHLTDEETTVLQVVDTYSELRYPNPAQGVEVGSDDWDRIDALLNKLWEQTPEVFDQYFQSIEPTRKGGRVLIERRIPKQDDP